MAKISGKTLNFEFSIEEELADLQSFTASVFPTSTTARSYRAREDAAGPGTNIFIGEAFFTGNFTYSSSFVTSADQVTGLISDFSFTYFTRNFLGQETGLSGVFQVDNLGKNSIDFVDFLSLQPGKLASTLLKGKDKITGSDFSDELNGYAGNDNIKGRNGFDVIDGGKGNDKLFGGKGTDIISGGSGNDKLLGGKGDNQLFGGAGIDTFVVDKKGRQFVEDFNPLEDIVDLPGPISRLNDYSFSVIDDKVILIGFAGDPDFLIRLSSNQAFTIDDVNII